MLLETGSTARAALAFVLLAGTALAQGTPSQMFSVSQTWQVPAATLSPGRYSIQVIDRMADRSIITIQSADGSIHSAFVGVPDTKIPPTAKPGPVMWSSDKENPYVRGWRFPGAHTVLEFAYPKAAAVSIARRQHSPVMAVDPDAEGMKAVPNALASKADMEVISLWLLSANPVGPDPEQAEIQATRYLAGSQPKRVTAIAASRLPKTASNFPLILLLTGLSFFLALSIRALRTRV